MCTLLFALEAHPDYPFVLAANRDEFHAREAEALHWWEPERRLLAGRDRERGGIWLGVARDGGLAAVTNVREKRPPQPNDLSRGAPPREFLNRRAECGLFLDQLSEEAERFPGCNLLLGRKGEFWWFSNRLPMTHSRPQAIYQKLSAGVYGLSNGSLNEDWPKVRRGREQLRALLQDGQPEAEALFHLLADESKGEPSELPDTGVGAELEHFLSSLFIRGESYGTRCSTVILRDRKGQWSVEERRFLADGLADGASRESFRESAS